MLCSGLLERADTEMYNQALEDLNCIGEYGIMYGYFYVRLYCTGFRERGLSDVLVLVWPCSCWTRPLGIGRPLDEFLGARGPYINASLSSALPQVLLSSCSWAFILFSTLCGAASSGAAVLPTNKPQGMSRTVFLSISAPVFFPKMFLSACRTRIPRCQRCHATEHVSPGLNDNVLRNLNSFVPPRRTLWWVSSWWLSCLSSLRHEQQ